MPRRNYQLNLYRQTPGVISDLDSRVAALEDAALKTPAAPPLGTLGFFWDGESGAAGAVITGRANHIGLFNGRNSDGTFLDDRTSHWNHFLPMLTFEKELADAGLL